jgi:hypothetical protein
MSNEYRYGLIHRPARIGSVPANKPYRLEPPLPDEAGNPLTRHGVIVFERPLSVEELYAFDLALLADEDLKEALAIEVALEIVELGESDAAIENEAPGPFRARIADILDKIRLYRVHVGDLSLFAQLVRARLNTFADQGQNQDADVLSILFARSHAPIRGSGVSVGSGLR